MTEVKCSVECQYSKEGICDQEAVELSEDTSGAYEEFLCRTRKYPGEEDHPCDSDCAHEESGHCNRLDMDIGEDEKGLPCGHYEEEE